MVLITSKKNYGGAPPKYKTVEEMQAKIDAYFARCAGEPLLGPDGRPELDKWGRQIRIGGGPPTVTGLALALGFATRKSLLDYQGKKAFVNTISRAKAKCEEYAEARLYDRDGTNGAQFSLRCNFGWNDKPADSGDDEMQDKIAVFIRATKPSPEEVKSLYDAADAEDAEEE